MNNINLSADSLTIKKNICKICVAFIFLCGTLFSGIIEDADVLYKKGEYVAAAEKLAPELSKEHPSSQALSLGIDIALASGESVSASRLASTLFRLSVKDDMDMVFKSAETADIIGEKRFAKNRYLSYISKTDAGGDKFRKAARYLFSEGLYPDILEKYITDPTYMAEGARDFYKDELIRSQINKVLNNLWTEKEVDKAISISDACMKYYSKAPYYMNDMLLKLYNSMRYLASPDQQLKVVNLISKYKFTDINRVVIFYRDLRKKGGVDEDVINAAMLEALKRSDVKISSELMWGSGSLPDLNTMEILEVKPELARKYGEYFLANEAAYKNNEDPKYYVSFLEKIAIYKKAFRADGNVLVTPAEFQQRVDELALKYKNNSREGASSLYTILEKGSSNYFDTDAERGKFLGRYVELLSLDPNLLGTYLKYSGTADNIDSIIEKSKPNNVVNAKYVELGSYHQLNKFNSLKKIILDYVNENPHYWNTDNAWKYYFSRGTNEIPDPEKMQTLNAIVLSEGKSDPLMKILSNMSKNGWDKKPEFVEFQKKCSAAKPIIKKPAYDIAHKILNSKDPVYVEASTKKFLDLYKGRVPGALEYAKNPMEVLSVRVFNHYRQLVSGRNQNEQFFKFCDIWVPRLKEPGELWNYVLEHTGSLDKTRLWETSKIYLQVLKNNPNMPFEQKAISYIADAKAPEAERNQSLFADYYKDMGQYYCLKYVAGMASSSWDQEFTEKEFAKVLSLYKMEFSSLVDFRSSVYDLFRSSSFSFSINTAELFANRLFELNKQYNILSYQLERFLFNNFIKTHKDDIETYVKWYLDEISFRPSEVQFNCINQIIYTEYWDFSPDFYKTVMIPKLNTLLNTELNIYSEVSLRLLTHLNNIIASEDEKWSSLKQPAKDLKDRLFYEIFTKNMVYIEHNQIDTEAKLFLGELTKEIASADNWRNIISGLSKYADIIYKIHNWGHAKRHYVEPMIDQLEKTDKNEIIYSFTGNILDYDLDNSEFQKYIGLVRGKASGGIKNLIPVPKSDPTYDLYVANQYLQYGNEMRAWELTQPKLKVLIDNWEKLDFSYNAWVVEQMQKQKLLDEGLKFCLTMLVKEYDIDAENAAKISLVKGDIYKDMNNNAAAKMEYEGLVDNKRYSNTSAGRDAKYRLIDIMIQTKEYGAAEAQLERMIDIGTIEEQANAYYYFAKIAFDQGDAEASFDYLKKCFALIHGHVQGRLLEGELKLILPRGLQDPEVKVGRLDLQTVVIPGKTLKLKLQDSNLSIAQGGKSIPVVVKTSSGDKEKIDLFAGSSDTTLFIGSIQTGLGEPKPGNLLLEVNGDDEVSYMIDPDFQKANEIDYPSKTLEIKSDARLVASSGEILSEKEEEERQLQRRLAQSQEVQSKRFEGRDNKTIRPGSDIYVEVTDFDMDVSSEKDKIFLDIATSSGDILSDYALMETSEHSGVFRGSIPTGLPYPLVQVSDKEEATDPNSVININKTESWKSFADRVKPKWIEVDTMNSHNFKEISIDCKDPDKVKALSLYGILARDDVLIAKYPEDKSDIKGGLSVRVAKGDDTSDRNIRRTIQYKTFGSYNVKETVFDREKTLKSKSDEYLVISMTGLFYIPQSRELKLRITSNKSESNNEYQGLRVSIDGKHIFGQPNMSKNEYNRTKKIFLSRGIHEFEGLIRTRDKDAIVALEYEKEDGSFALLPEEWFSIEKNEELAKELLPKGTITKTENGFKAVLEPPTRFRKFRWVFEDFSSPIVEVEGISAIDSDGKKILPVEKDFTQGIRNRTVEVAPGDEITIKYKDDKRISDDMLFKEAQLNSSFADAEVGLYFEKITLSSNGKESSEFSLSKRIRKGDQLMAIVTDYDEDMTDERDKVMINIKTSSGESLNMNLLETARIGTHNHAGSFAQILKFGDVTGGNTIKIMTNDYVTVTYLDKENTDPGIPFERTYSVDVEERDNPDLTIYKTDIMFVEDNSEKALNKIRSIKKDGTAPEDMKIMKELVTVTHMPEGEEVGVVNVNAPLIFQLYYPKMAKHKSSVFNVDIISDSEIEAAKKENRVAVTNQVPVPIRNLITYAPQKGFPLKTSDVSFYDDEEMLERGVFAGVVRLQLGSPGDPVNKYIDNESSEFLTENQIQQFDQDSGKYTVPTILVSGSDAVTMIISNEKGKVLLTRRIRLLSDGRLELLDKTYSAPVESIHLGQKFYVRLTDPDQDTTDDSDSVTINVKSESNDELSVVLRETLPHSGIFTATLEPSFIEKDATGQPISPDKTDETLRVNFGDTVNFEYIDSLSMSSTNPLPVSIQGYICKGADGKIASFTKSFKDPDMAVKTRFLMAEAKFEVAKEYRKLEKTEEAEIEIAEGKRILEDAMRDYPDTNLKAQGEFLLANLSQEIGDYEEAIGRYSNVINNWPASEYAIRSQLKKAISFEKLEQFDQACEEYVKLTYLYPDSKYVADASIRMGNYYYKHKQYPIASQIFLKFQKKNPAHELAPKSLFIAANCLMRVENDKEELAKSKGATNVSGDYSDAIRVLKQLIDEYKDDNDLSSEAMYWLGDSLSKQKEYKEAYQTFKKLTWDYPATKWAKIARGRLTDNNLSKYDEE
jgi:TolA-binding protein